MVKEFDEAQGSLGAIGRQMAEDSDMMAPNQVIRNPMMGSRVPQALSQTPKVTARPTPTMEKDIAYKRVGSSHGRNISEDERNVALDRMNLVKRRQHDGETFNNYYTSLRILAEDAQLRDMDCNAWMSTLRRLKLLSHTPTLDLKDTLALCRSDEKGRVGNADLECHSKTMIAAARINAALTTRTGNQNFEEYLPMGTTVKVGLKLGGRRTKEVISFCKSITGFYLSRHACKSLGTIPEIFPQPMPIQETKVGTNKRLSESSTVSPEEIMKTKSALLFEY
ncbi:hypothetical protein TCAL_15662, partial [Tigriopus californicus]